MRTISTVVERTIAPLLKDLFRRYPFVTVTGPRQSGKTTLCRTALPELAYVDLESPEHRQFAEDDPKRFLSTWSGGVILDEIQRVPPLLSWLQVFADEHGGNGLGTVVHGGDERQTRSAGDAVPVTGFGALLGRFDGGS